ncbi:MAG: SOS response-associated peptidase [Actinomycetaceae bacterium]|nr:SOS response-associated peptidase [Actinomycetaceae bacterium]MDU0971174.1 SOS response-associated peptidase [Actinomycetaceae bacterium]
MCGRYALWAGEEHLATLFDIDEVVDPGFTGSWNVAPGQGVPAVMERYADPHATAPSKRGEGKRQLRCLQWGFIPHWAKSDSRPMINARAETLTEKPSFRDAAHKRRCLIPANGYFEWQQEQGGKQPWFLSAGEGDPLLAFAGLYEAWRPGEGQPWVRTCAIVTRSAPDAIGQIHDRCPLVVPQDMWADWLDPRPLESPEVRRMIDAIPVPELTPRKVSRAVGNVANNSPDLVAEIS